jgi:flagellar motor protein MotB
LWPPDNSFIDRKILMPTMGPPRLRRPRPERRPKFGLIFAHSKNKVGPSFFSLLKRGQRRQLVCVMNDSPQPFTDHVTRKSSSSRSAWVGWSVAVVAAVLAAVFLGLWNTANANHQRELEVLQQTADGAKSDLARAEAQNQTNQDLIATLTNQVAGLQKEKEAVTKTSKSLEDEMRADLESKDVTISKLQGKLTVNIVDRVMFDSGEAVLKPDGEVVMRKIASILQEHPQLAIHVIGHTDNIPIRQTAQSRFASNWELSTARALAAVHFLTERAGVDPRRVGAVGYGEFRPVADNATAEGRAKNRRIAITILPEELIPTDATPAAKSNPETNSLPLAPNAN